MCSECGHTMNYLRITEFGLRCGSNREECMRDGSDMCLQLMCYWGNQHIHFTTFAEENGASMNWPAVLLCHSIYNTNHKPFYGKLMWSSSIAFSICEITS